MSLSRRSVLAASLGTLALPAPSRAQSPGKGFRIGFITAQQEASIAPNLGFIRGGLAEEGFVEGGNLSIEYRFGNDEMDRVPGFARELAEMPVDLLIVQGPAVARVAALNLSVPLIYVTSSDPVLSGLAESLARPIGNKTGVTFMAFEFASKRLEMLHELMPRAERVIVFGNPEHLGTARERAFSEDVGKRLGLHVGFSSISTRADIDDACRRVVSENFRAISLLADGFAVQNRQVILDFATKTGIPTVSGWPVFAQSGALFTYGPRLSASYRRLAHYAARILRGARPADLPVERPAVFQTVLNLKAAKSLGIPISRPFLARADEVIA